MHVSGDTSLAEMDRMMAQGRCADANTARVDVIELRKTERPRIADREDSARNARRPAYAPQPPAPPPPGGTSFSQALVDEVKSRWVRASPFGAGRTDGSGAGRAAPGRGQSPALSAPWALRGMRGPRH